MASRFLIIIIYILKQSISWWSHGHMIISRITELSLQNNPEVLQKIYKLLGYLKNSFPETENSLLEASVVADLLMNNYQGFLDFAHYINKPIIYQNEKIEDFKLRSNNIYNVTKTFENSLTILKNYLNDGYHNHNVAEEINLKNDNNLQNEENAKINKNLLNNNNAKKNENLQNNENTTSETIKKTNYIVKGLFESLMLRYLLHVCGDIHQPLHTSNFYSNILFDGKIARGDEGGNLIKVYNIFTKEYTNLHSIWDSAIGLYDKNFKLPLKKEDVEIVDKDAKELMTTYSKEYFGDSTKIINYNTWLQESFSLTQEFVYTDVESFPLLRAEYILKSRRIARKRIALAGYRMAELLTSIFDK